MKLTKTITETGSVYLFNMKTLQMKRADHTNKSDDLRKDGEWVQMLLKPEITQGEPMRIALEPLGEGDVTLRYTTPVLSVEEIDVPV